MTPESGNDIEPLLAHAAWVQRLAGRLVADAHEAEDLVQETWLTVLRAQWRERDTGKSFLSGVLRNRALHQRRTEARRRAREAVAGPPGVAPPAAEALEKAELGRELARLAMELEEPFRSAVVLRHFSDLPPRAIAEKLGVSVKTVDSRLARGHARLRERWKRRHPGGADTWLSSLAFLGTATSSSGWPGAPSANTAPAGTTAPALGALIVNTKLVLAALAVAGGGGLLWLAASMTSGTSGAEAAPAVALARAPERPALDEGARATEPVTDARRAPDVVAPAAREVSGGAKKMALSRTLRGRVVDPEELPLAGVEVAFTAPGREPELGTSGPNGTFQFDTPPTSGRVAAVDPGLESLFVFHPRPTSEAKLLLVVAPHRPLGGVVRDGTGAPLPGARVALLLPEDFRTRFDAVLDSADRREWASIADAQGHFRIERAPRVAGATVEARLDGYETAALAAPPGPAEALVLTLRQPEPTDAILAGRVVDASGQPVQGARTSLGERTAITARDGTFRLDRADAFDAFELVAVLPGRLPGRYRALADPVSGAPLWPDWIEIALGGDTLELSGRVVDPRGRPRPRVKLWLEDPTRFGLIEGDTLGQLEYVAAPEDSTYEPGDAYFRVTRTDDEGRFRIQGLLERDYRLGLLDVDTLESARTGPFAAGRDDVEIVLPRSEPGRLFGRLVSRAGRPVEGARIWLHAHQFGGVHHRAAQALTDSDGRFAFDGIAGEDLSLWIRGDQIVPSVQGASPADEELELVVDVLCHFKVDLGDAPQLADSVRVYDADGTGLDLHEIGAGGYLSTSASNLVDGRSATLGVSDAAATLVLEKGGEEVRRLSLQLEPGNLRVVSP